MSKFDIKVTPNKMGAYLTIHKPTDNVELTIEQVKEYLNLKNITYGLIENNIKQAIENESWEEKILVSQGREVVEGKDAYVDYTFDPDPDNSPQEREDGSLDFHRLNKIQNISAEEKLAELFAPVEGEAGMDISGKVVKPKQALKAKLLRGKNTRFNEEKTQLFAEIDGIIMLRKDGTIEVSPRFNIDGDIDLSVGDIEIKGDLTIGGDIKSGFVISASGNIEIGGTIEDAQITAGGSVNVRGGFVGEGRGRIVAGGDVEIKFINHQKIEAGGNIEIFEEAKGAHLVATGSIFVKKGKGVLAGGVAKAAIAIEANTLGTMQNVNTDVIVADTTKIQEKIVARNKECQGMDQKIEEISKKMNFLMKKKKKVGLSAQDEQLFKNLDKLSADIDYTISTLRGEVKSSEETINNLRKTAYIKVIEMTYPGVTMKIAGAVKYHENEREATTFKVFNGDIIGLEEVEETAKA